jgi:hypothetical protein
MIGIAPTRFILGSGAGVTPDSGVDERIRYLLASDAGASPQLKLLPLEAIRAQGDEMPRQAENRFEQDYSFESAAGRYVASFQDPQA